MANWKIVILKKIKPPIFTRIGGFESNYTWLEFIARYRLCELFES